MQSEKYYLDRAAQMRLLAAEASTEGARQGFLKAAEAYEALAKTAPKAQDSEQEK